jgi:hypothetical protein
MSFGDQELRTLSQSLNDRINAAFDGNTVEGASVQVRRQAATNEAANIRIELALGWSFNWTTETGSLVPTNSVHCSNQSDLEARLNDCLNATIKDPREARRLEAKYVNSFASLIEYEQPQFTFRQLEERWHYCHKCASCSGHGTVWCGCHLGRETCSLCLGAGTLTTGENVNGQMVSVRRSCGFCFGSGDATCRRCSGLQYINCQNCGARGWFTTIYTAEITATIYKSITSIESKLEDFAKTLKALPIEQLAKQGAATQTTSNINNGSVIFDYHVILPYARHAYCVKESEFEVHGIGMDIIVPEMPPVLDDVIRPVTEKIYKEKGNPNRALKAAEGCRVTRELLSAIGNQAKVDAKTIAGSFHHAVSTETVQRIAMSLSAAYNSCGATVIWRIWVKSFIVLNLAIAVFVMSNGFSSLAKFLNISDQLGTRYLTAFIGTLILLGAIKLMAGRAALKVVRNIVGPDVNRAPSQGLMPKVLGMATIVIALSLVQFDYQDGKSRPPSSGLRTNIPIVATQSTARSPNIR